MTRMLPNPTGCVATVIALAEEDLNDAGLMILDVLKNQRDRYARSTARFHTRLKFAQIRGIRVPKPWAVRAGKTTQIASVTPGIPR